MHAEGDAIAVIALPPAAHVELDVTQIVMKSAPSPKWKLTGDCIPSDLCVRREKHECRPSSRHENVDISPFKSGFRRLETH